MKKLVISLATALLASIFSLPAQNSRKVDLYSIAGRENVTSLDGMWRNIVDPFENGYYDYRLNPTDGGYAQDRNYVDHTRLQEYDFGTASQLAVPGDWNTQTDKLYYYEGTVWYRKHFDYDLAEGKRLFAHFGAANYETIVWVNGKRVGQHIGGFTPFCFEITDVVKKGENSIVVKVDNKRHPEAVPTVNSDWWNFGGITRPVSLVETPSTFIKSHKIGLKNKDVKKIECSVTLDGPQAAGREVTVEIPELKIKRNAIAGADGKLTFEVKAAPELWTPENPKLYAVSITSGEETVRDEIGFRTIETKGNKMLLNGKEVFLRGICIHEETAYDSGRAWSREHAHTLLSWAKELGCNFVRLAHYPHNEEMVREAERMGLMVWSEIPVYWTIHWNNPDTYANAEAQLSDMIGRDINRANIIIWSVANETPRSEPRNEFLTRLVNKARELDGSRLVGAAMEKDEPVPGKLTINDPLGKVLDVLSFNEYVGWYDGNWEKCDRVDWSFDIDKPVLITECGGGGVYGYHGSDRDHFTEEYQTALYEHHVAMLKRIPGLSGVAPWILKDFRSPRRHLADIQDDFNRKGLISDKGQRKPAFYVLQKWYKEIAGQE